MYRERNGLGSEMIVQKLLLFIPSAVAEKVNYSACYSIPNENDESFKSCKRFSLLSAHEEKQTL